MVRSIYIESIFVHPCIGQTRNGKLHLGGGGWGGGNSRRLRNAVSGPVARRDTYGFVDLRNGLDSLGLLLPSQSVSGREG